MSKARGVIAVMVILIVGALSAIACGGDDDDDAGNGATATDQQSSATEAASTDSEGETEDTGAAEETTAPAVETEPATSGISADDTCGLITKAEVEEALGESILAPEGGDVIDTSLPGGGSAAVGICSYTSESFASSISVTFWSAPGSDDGIDGMINLACSGKETISGLGDKACWYDDQHVQIQAAKGGNFLDMFATMSGDASDVLSTLAEKAVGRMQ